MFSDVIRMIGVRDSLDNAIQDHDLASRVQFISELFTARGWSALCQTAFVPDDMPTGCVFISPFPNPGTKPTMKHFPCLIVAYQSPVQVQRISLQTVHLLNSAALFTPKKILTACPASQLDGRLKF